MPSYGRKSTSRYAKKRPQTKTSKKRPATRRAPKSNFQRSKVPSLPKPSVAVQRGSSLFPATYLTRLKYAENTYVSASGTTGLTALGFTYRLNDMYDPRLDVGGNQPLEYDAMAAIYNHVITYSAKITMEFSNPSHDGMYVGYRIRPQTDGTGTAALTLDAIQEKQWTKCRPLNNTGKQTCSFSVYVPISQVFGITKVQYAEIETYGHQVGTDPVLNALLEPFACHTVAGETATVRINTKITFYSKWSSRQTPDQS